MMTLNMYCYLIFFPMMILSSLMILISNSWFSQWMIMEINLISFISMIVFEKKNNSVFMNYFLVQSFNSYIFIMMSMNLNFLNEYISSFIFLMINLCLLTKMGLPPFFMWYINIMKFLSWMNCLLLMTVQKFIPLMILNNLSEMNDMLVMNFNLLNLIYMSLVCALIGLQAMNLKVLMAYSSIIQMSWMIALIYLSEQMLMNYLMIYYLISLAMVMIFIELNLNYLSDVYSVKFGDKLILLFNLSILLSLSGIPPFWGFLMKWISIQTMSNSYSFFIAFALIMNSLVSMYFYLRIMFKSFINYSSSFKLNILPFEYWEPEYKLLFIIWLCIILLLIFGGL